MSDRIGNYTDACPFLDVVPVEIRIHIFEYILFENGNFFSLDDEEGNSVPTLFPKLRAPLNSRDQRHHAPEPQAVVVDGGGRRPGVRGNVMSLLLTSQKM